MGEVGERSELDSDGTLTAPNSQCESVTLGSECALPSSYAPAESPLEAMDKENNSSRRNSFALAQSMVEGMLM